MRRRIDALALDHAADLDDRPVNLHLNRNFGHAQAPLGVPACDVEVTGPTPDSAGKKPETPSPPVAIGGCRMTNSSLARLDPEDRSLIVGRYCQGHPPG